MKATRTTEFNKDVKEGRHGNLSQLGSWRRKSWKSMTYGEKATLASYILVAYKGTRTAEAAAAYFGISFKTALLALRQLQRHGEIIRRAV
jgi:hypothetical protein